jgi:flagellar biosynthesis protein FlhG
MAGRDDDAQQPGPRAPQPAAPPAPAPRIRPRPRRVIVVSGAKGGVGKTVFATNLGLYLATIGRQVIVVDADAGGANAHTCLGVERPRMSPADGPLGPIVDTPVPGLRLMRAGIDLPATGSVRTLRRARLLEGLRATEAEYLVVDLGAGTVSSLLDLMLQGDLALYLTLPEPTAIENTYRFIRGAFARRLRLAAPTREVRKALLARLRESGGAPAPLDLLRDLEGRGDPLADLVRQEMASFVPRIVLNQTRVRADLELGDHLRSAVYRRFGLEVDYLGHIDYDDTVWSCVRTLRPLLVESPGTKASKSIEKIARRILALESKGRTRPLRTVPPGSHHDLLEVDRGATDEEIRRAYKRAKEVFAPDALCCYGLFDKAELAALRVRLDEAYDVLLDPARRRPYELGVFPEDVVPERDASAADAQREPLPPRPEINPETEFTGALLRAVRESQGVELKDVSATTKIGVPHLRALEDDDFSALPAVVYVRGFVGEIAKVLHLDAQQVSRTYVRRYRRFLDGRARS